MIFAYFANINPNIDSQNLSTFFNDFGNIALNTWFVQIGYLQRYWDENMNFNLFNVASENVVNVCSLPLKT